MARQAFVWSFVAHTIPIYSLYSLLFRDSGVSTAQVSALFAIWSTVGIIAEVPAGAVADRYSRRGAIVSSGIIQAMGYGVWLLDPTFVGFAIGFALWSIGSAFSSGSFEALVYEGLVAHGTEAQYPHLIGRIESAGMISQLPAAGAASVLFTLGGYQLVGWVSVGVCLASSALATRLPEHRHLDDATDSPAGGYFEVLRAGLGEMVSKPLLRAATLTVALLFGLDAIEEYFPLQIESWGVSVTWVPVVVLLIPAAGAVGAAMTGAGSRLSGRTLAIMLGIGALLLCAAAVVARPAGVFFVVAFYGLYRLVLGVADARLQKQITGPARATVTSMAALAGEIVGISLFGVWAIGGLPAAAILIMAVAVALPRWSRRAAPPSEVGQP